MALEFDGVDQYIEVSDSDDWNFGAGNVSIMVGLKFNAVANYMNLLSISGAAADESSALDYNPATGKIHWYFYNAAKALIANHSTTNNQSLSTGVRYDIIVVRSGNTCYIFINGASKAVTVGVAFSGALPDYPGSLYIGRFRGASNALNGAVLDARIYKSKAVSLAESKIIYESKGSDNIVDSLVGRWLMNEKTDGETATVASSVIDISGNGNHGSPANSPVYRAAPMRLVGSIKES